MERGIQGSLVAYLGDTPPGLSHLHATGSGRTPRSRATYCVGDAIIMGILRSPHQLNSHHGNKRVYAYLSAQGICRVSDNWSRVVGFVRGLFMESLGPSSPGILSFSLKFRAPVGGACR